MASDLTLMPDYVYTEEIAYKTAISEFENGVEQRRSLWPNPKRKFTLQYNNRSSSDLETIQTLFQGKLGAFGSLTFTNPNDDTEYTVRFVEDSLKVEKVFYELYNFQFDLIEVF